MPRKRDTRVRPRRRLEGPGKGELITHLARGKKTICGLSAAGLVCQHESRPLTEALCCHCREIITAYRSYIEEVFDEAAQ